MVREALGRGSILLVCIFEFVGILLALFLFGLDLWIPVQMVLVFVACSMRGLSMAGTMITANAILGMGFTIFLVGFPTWPSALVGVIAIIVIFQSYGSGIATPEAGGELNA